MWRGRVPFSRFRAASFVGGSLFRGSARRRLLVGNISALCRTGGHRGVRFGAPHTVPASISPAWNYASSKTTRNERRRCTDHNSRLKRGSYFLTGITVRTPPGGIFASSRGGAIRTRTSGDPACANRRKESPPARTHRGVMCVSFCGLLGPLVEVVPTVLPLPTAAGGQITLTA